MHKFQSLSLSKIDSSPEVISWLAQFSDEDKTVAKQLLLRLRFVGRDVFASWLKQSLSEFTNDEKYAVFAIRKIDACEQDDNEIYF